MRMEFEDFTLEGSVDEIVIVLDAMGYTAPDYPTDEELEREFPNFYGTSTKLLVNKHMESPSDNNKTYFVDYHNPAFACNIHAQSEANCTTTAQNGDAPYTYTSDQTELPFSDGQEIERDIPED